MDKDGCGWMEMDVNECNRVYADGGYKTRQKEALKGEHIMFCSAWSRAERRMNSSTKETGAKKHHNAE